ncbi:hypothetical protein VTJ04DRAFT_7449 [Mycothermus thermophilus]|uniref:uncharacterized protein n=1 Tax=Humicola insolens TaxID=85995 RepID=UPI003743382B
MVITQPQAVGLTEDSMPLGLVLIWVSVLPELYGQAAAQHPSSSLTRPPFRHSLDHPTNTALVFRAATSCVSGSLQVATP